MADGRFVGYIRVSTKKQGESALGLEAQQKAIEDYLNGGSSELMTEFREVESGKRDDRPELLKALEFCRKHKATLLIAKLDRLSREVAFIVKLKESKVRFVACDAPNDDEEMLYMRAVFAQMERKQIAARTKAALQAAKRRGKKLGWSNPARKAEQIKASKRGSAANAARAKAFAANVLPVIRDIQTTGVAGLKAIADALNTRGIKTARGSRWYPSSVSNVLARAA